MLYIRGRLCLERIRLLGILRSEPYYTYYKSLGLRHDHYFVTAKFLTLPIGIMAQNLGDEFRYI